MSKTNTGGSAFPIPGDQPDESFNGATLRDYFAAKAMETARTRNARNYVTVSQN